MTRVNQSDLPGRLIDEAARLLIELGPAGLSLRKVAAACGVSTMPVYTLFGDKQGLLAAMYREGFRRLGARLEAVRATDDPLADLIALGMAYRGAAVASPHLYGLMFGRMTAELSADDPARETGDAAYQPLVDAVERCQRAGTFRGADDPQRVALHLWAVAHGMVNLELNEQIPPADRPEDLFRQALDYAVAPFRPEGDGER